MEFLKERVYTALNADELKVGSKVYLADDLADLRHMVETDNIPMHLKDIVELEKENAELKKDSKGMAL